MNGRLNEKTWGGAAKRLARLLDGGVPMLEALSFLSQRGSVKEQELMKKIATELRSGRTLAQTLAFYQAPLMMLTLVEVGEQNGDLAGSLFRVAMHCEERVKWQQERRQAAAYPLLVGIVLLLVSGFLLGSVVPRFADLYTGMGLPVAGGTQMLFLWAEQAPYLFLALFVGVGGSFAMLKRPSVRKSAIMLLNRVPVIRNWLRLERSHEWAALLGLLLDGGLPLVQALDVQAQLPMQRANQLLCGQVKEGVLQGKRLGDVLGGGELDEELILAVQVAEVTGDLSRTLLLAERDLAERRKQFMDSMIKWLEPLLLGLCGGLVGVVALLLLWPMLDLLHAI